MSYFKWIQKTGRQNRSQVPSQGLVPVWGGGYNERCLEGEYGRNVTYSCMKMEKWDCWNYSRNGGRGIMKNDGGGQFNYDIV
jgi:hypothetical protein